MRAWQQGLGMMWHFLGRGRSRPASILLAVAWGTLSMMLLLGFGEGLKVAMLTRGASLGDRPVILWPGSTTKPWQGLKPGRPVSFLEEDLVAVKREVPEIDQIAGERRYWGADMRWGTKSVSAQLTGVMPCYERVRAHYPRAGGRFINDVDQARARRVLFIGAKLKDRLFGPAKCIGQTVFVRGVPFTVIGVMIDKKQSGMYGGPDDEKASIPLSTFESVFGKQPYRNVIYTVRPESPSKEVQSKVREVFARRYHFDPKDESAVYIWDTADNEVEIRKIMNGIEAFLGIVGAMTLLVAGVGLANMLFVMVQRRTREIGLQMAIGAQRAAVTAQIIGESLVLAGIGGYLGIGLSWLIVEIVERIPIKSEGLQFLGKPTLSIPLGVVTVVVLIGIACLAGSLPARRAVRLNPVEALRHE